MPSDSTPAEAAFGEGEPVDRWKPARLFPETYPGDHPPGHYLLHEDTVRPVHAAPDRAGWKVAGPQGVEPLEGHLKRLGLPGLDDRFPVLAYGANRNPATLRIKALNYGYRPPNGRDCCLPVLRGTVTGADIAVCNLHGQGYFYGELLMDQRLTAATTLDVHVCLADREMLRILNASEGVATGTYALAEVPEVRLADGSVLSSALGYIARAPVWTSPHHHSPVSYAGSTAANRGLPALTSREIMDHVLDVLGLRPKISALSGLSDTPELASALAGYLNRRWWSEFYTPGSASDDYHAILGTFRARMAEGALPFRTLDHLTRLGRVLPTEHADSLGPAHTWAALRSGPA